MKEDIEINAHVFQAHPKEELTTTPTPILEHPTPDQIEANYKKWEYQK